MANVTPNTLFPVDVVYFYVSESSCRLNLRIDYIKAPELLDRLSTVHESDLVNAVEFVFCLIDRFSSPLFFSLFQGLYSHIPIVLAQNILMND